MCVVQVAEIPLSRLVQHVSFRYTEYLNAGDRISIYGDPVTLQQLDFVGGATDGMMFLLPAI